MAEPDKRTKAIRVLTGIANLAADMLLPTLIYLALTPTGLSASLRLTVGGILLGAKAISGRIETGEFRWRLALLTAIVPLIAVFGCHLAGCGDRISMVAGAIAGAVIVLADLARTRLRKTAHGTPRPPIDTFAIIVLAEVVTSVVLTSISGDARFVLARGSFYLAVAGLIVLASTWTDRPMMRVVLKPVAAKGDPLRAAAYDRLWASSKRFRTIYRTVNGSLGLVLLADAVLRIVVIYSFSSGQIAQSGLASQLPFVMLIAAWFLINRGLLIPRARRMLDAECDVAQGSEKELSPPAGDFYTRVSSAVRPTG
ncbi:VC0807 family protein [Nocardia miyunensis]|uniref:VC0807 family protein n=1 Tax=Nocardia miyunensis TaxID=282684 RepID=UPI0008305B2F|nr:VC0807 family protein [Nocardia miyunensis]